MDIDRFISAHRQDWARLAALLDKAGRRPTRLSADELDELASRYARTATHLSIARTQFADRALTAELSALVARGSALLYGSPGGSWAALARFVTATLPAAIWHTRRFHLAATLLFFLPAVVAALWIGYSPAALEATAPAAAREAYVTEDFEAYYSSDPSAQFATEVTVNNIQVSILAFAGGGLAGLLTVFVLLLNGFNVGVALGFFIAAGEQAKFWGLITPHGLLEITAVLLAGGAGLRLGWTLIDPGDRRRTSALREEGRRAIVILAGLTIVFLIAGLIEGFVTGSTLPTTARVGIGVVAEVVFLAYVVVWGRRATAAGLTGAIGEQRDAGWQRTRQSRPVAFTSR